MPAFATKDVQILLDQPKGRGMLVSCYADTSVSDGFSSHWLQPFKTESSRIRQQFGDDEQARLAFERDIEAIRGALEAPQVRQARGMAVFSAAGRGFLLAIPALEPYENRLVVDEEPYVVPLLEADFRRQGYLVIQSDTHRARWYAAGPGGSRLLGDIDEFVPKKQHSSGERWGKQQATIERHRKDHILHFQKELARRVEEAWSTCSYQGIILLGQHEVVEELRSYLPTRLSSRVVHEAAQAWTKGDGEIDEVVRGVLRTAEADTEGRVLSDLESRLKEGIAVAAGPQEVIDALRNGQVAALILGPDSGARVSRCTGCGASFVLSHTECPYCHAPCQKGNLWQAILLLAVKHGVRVHRVHPSKTLSRHEGAAALLARDEPQWAVVSELKGTTPSSFTTSRSPE